MFKEIPYFPGYFADSKGNIYSNRLGNNLRGKRENKLRKIKPRLQHPNSRLCYLSVQLRCDGKSIEQAVHRLILQTFVGDCPNGMEACHNNGKHHDNKLRNLRWDTRKNNQADRLKHGTSNRGSRHGLAKLNKLQARIIKKYPKHSGYRIYLSKVFNVSIGTISHIQQEESWSYI